MSHRELPEGIWGAEVGSVELTCGAGCLALLGETARRFAGVEAPRVLLVTDPGLVAAGHAHRALASLRSAGCEAALFDGASENPTGDEVAAGAEAARAVFSGGRGPDLLAALGGGSALDAAKGINFLLTNGGSMEDYWGYGKAKQPLLPSVAVPTTAGTGSDAQSYALITHPVTHRKMACGDRGARFRAVLLDPELAATAPRRVAAAAGIDALSHAVEALVTRRRNPVSTLYARQAWALLETHLPVVLSRRADEADEVGAASDENGAARGAEGKRNGMQTPDHRVKREGMAGWEGMLLGAHLAGAAIENSMLGAAHAAANPLTARYGTVHGVAVGLMLPHVIRFNAPVVGELYGELIGGLEAAPQLARRVEELRSFADLPSTLRELGIPREDLRDLAHRATAEWTGSFNPRALTEDDFFDLYEAAYD